MEDGPDFSNRRRWVFIASGLMDMLLGGALVSLGLGILPAGLVSFRLPPLATLLGAVLLVAGMAVVIYNLTRLGE